MDRDPLNTQMVVDLQEEDTENLSLQDEEDQFLHVIPQFLLLMVVSRHGVLKRKPKKQSYNNCLKQILNHTRRAGDINCQ